MLRFLLILLFKQIFLATRLPGWCRNLDSVCGVSTNNSYSAMQPRVEQVNRSFILWCVAIKQNITWIRIIGPALQGLTFLLLKFNMRGENCIKMWIFQWYNDLEKWGRHDISHCVMFCNLKPGRWGLLHGSATCPWTIFV